MAATPDGLFRQALCDINRVTRSSSNANRALSARPHVQGYFCNTLGMHIIPRLCSVGFVCGCEVQQAYISHRSSGYGIERWYSCNPGIVAHAHIPHRRFRYTGNVIQNLQNSRVRVRKCYITHRSSGHSQRVQALWRGCT